MKEQTILYTGTYYRIGQYFTKSCTLLETDEISFLMFGERHCTVGVTCQARLEQETFLCNLISSTLSI